MLNIKITNNSVSEKLLKILAPNTVDIKLKMIEVNINVLTFLNGHTKNLL